METDLMGLGCCGRIGRIDRIDLIGHIDQSSSRIVGLGCGWCPLQKSNHDESHLENWYRIGISIRSSVHPKVVSVV